MGAWSPEGEVPTGQRGHFCKVLRHLALAGLLAAGLGAPHALAAQDEPVEILALGDSLVAGYGLPADEGFVPQLEAALAEQGIEAEVIDGGVSGDTTAGGRARLDWLLAEKPDYAIVELGANDGLRGLDPAEMRKNLDAILTRFDEEGIPVLLAGMLAPPNYGDAYEEEFNAVFPELAEKHDAVFYPFFLDGVAADPSLNQDDGIHPNAEGVAVIVERIMPYLLQLLERAPAGGA